jgi:asparagine synthase (glutamine-hydrolysing)
MRGAFVAGFGRSVDVEVMERAAAAHRVHRGVAERHSAASLRAVLLVEGPDGPRFEAGGNRAMVVHGRDVQPIAELERHGDRFAAVQSMPSGLLAARDPMGLCPLFYRLLDETLWLATEVWPLVALGPTRPDLGALAAQAALVPLEVHTGWCGIFRVLPGHRLEVSVDMEIRQRPYWRPADFVASYRGTARDAEEELEARLLAAVDRCLDDRSAVLLSGGLDSTAIALSMGGRRPPSVHVTFPEVSGANEVQHARAVADAVGSDFDVVVGDLSPWDPEQELRVAAVPYMSPPALTADRGLGHIAERGLRTALDGNDGDGVLGYNGREWGELVLTGAIRRLAELGQEYGPTTVLRGVVEDIAPVLRMRRVRGRPAPGATYLQKIERYFQDPLHLRMRDADHERWRWPVGEWRARQLRQVMPVTTIRMEEHELRAAYHGLDMRHPFADRELVEFLISLPASLKTDPFRSKALLRRAIAHRGPAGLLERPDKPLYYDVLGLRLDPARCLACIRGSGVLLPLLDYRRLYEDADTAGGVPLMLLVFLARAHVFAAANK